MAPVEPATNPLIMENNPIKILILEDNEMDAELIKMVLRKHYSQPEFSHVDNREDYTKALDVFMPDVILSDNTLPQFNATEALAILKKKFPFIPFILVTGTVSEEFAAGIIKLGADDYLLKDRMARLPAAIDTAWNHRKSEKEKHLMRKRLRQSEENYRTIMGRVSDGFVAIDRNWKYTYVNSKAGEILMRPQEELMGNDLREEFPDLLDHKFFADYSIAMNEQRYVYSEGYYAPFGIWIENHIYPSLQGLSIFFRDITEKKEAEKQKEFDHSNLTALINNTNDLVWSVDRQYNLITSNEAFNKLVHILTNQWPVKGSSILLEGLKAEENEYHRRCYDRAFAGESFTEIVHDTKPHEFWSEISYYPIYETGAVVGTACFSRNITGRIKSQEQQEKSHAEKKAMAERLSAIINTLPANIALLNREGDIVDVNDSWRNFADENGFIGVNHAVGDNYLEVTKRMTGENKADAKVVFKGIKAVLDHESEEFVFEYPCHSPKVKRWFRMIATALKQKEYSGAVVMHIDISELRRLERERLELKINEQKKITKAMLQAQEKERNYIGQELHDNINQILAGTKLYLGSAGNKNKEVKELIKYPMQLIDSSIEEIRLLCHRLVTPLKNINLQVLLTELVRQLDLLAPFKTSFTYSLTVPHLPDELKLNIYRIIQEQINNITKYAKAKHVTISLTETGNKIRIFMQDDGQGFEMEKKRNGIGISNMINRVEFFNGEIQLESAIGKGCRIEIEIPY